MTRKEELQKELSLIEEKEIKVRLEDAKKAALLIKDKSKEIEAKSHRTIMYGDFGIKFFIALAISAAFMHIVYTGNAGAMEEQDILNISGSGNFQLLSVVGPLFGMVLQYYFGTKKKSANGE